MEEGVLPTGDERAYLGTWYAAGVCGQAKNGAPLASGWRGWSETVVVSVERDACLDGELCNACFREKIVEALVPAAPRHLIRKIGMFVE